MVEKARRTKIEQTSRNDTGREWEVFVREEQDTPLRHVGSVTAPTAEVANEHASRLFGWYADDLWLCPADEVHRYSTHELAEDEGEDGDDTPTDADDSESPGNSENGAPDTSDSPDVVDEEEPGKHQRDDEPRVTEL